MKVKYIGENIGATGLTNNKIYDVLEVDDVTGALRIIDDSEEECGYLYSPTQPQAMFGKYTGGKFEIIEDDSSGSLSRALNDN